MTRKIQTKKKTPRAPKAPCDDQWRISDALWKKIEPLLLHHKPDPLGCHGPPVEPRKAVDAVFFVSRTGCQWNALNATGLCSSSSAHRWFQEWTRAGVFLKLWKMGLIEYDRRRRIGWRWQSLDAALTKAPLGGGKKRPQPDRPGQTRRQTQPADRRQRHPDWAGHRRRQSPRQQAGKGDPGKRAGSAAQAHA
jgi:putative transposase